ncbi:hypothetical protein K8354_02650 [Polaribacter litorisediminis]|uniref:hypothetical protein n=1 Tax=Polaribacter litorisediminis TaxID=1908341 RepID=UPI001CC1A01C|nr:hypothetical protein [Polaribacter litorisediminis]UAM98743.1 hypothetical protein K8354_02650 [Polaribacter litorisediminis]
MVKELHKCGYGNLRVIPSISPNGLAWRCEFIDQKKQNDFIASTWIESKMVENYKVEMKLSPQELADLFIKENINFLEHCKEKNEEYEHWYGQMVDSLTEKELPYAFDYGEYFYPTDYWLTTKNKKIVKLLNGN